MSIGVITTNMEISRFHFTGLCARDVSERWEIDGTQDNTKIVDIQRIGVLKDITGGTRPPINTFWSIIITFTRGATSITPDTLIASPIFTSTGCAIGTIEKGFARITSRGAH